MIDVQQDEVVSDSHWYNNLYHTVPEKRYEKLCFVIVTYLKSGKLIMKDHLYLEENTNLTCSMKDATTSKWSLRAARCNGV